MSKTAIMGKIIWFASKALLVALMTCGSVGLADEQVLAGQMHLEEIPTPTPGLGAIPWGNEIGEDYLDEDMAAALASHGGMGLDGSTYSEHPIGPCDFLSKGVCCPPTWYTEQQVRVLTRSRSRGGVISAEYLPDESAVAGQAVTSGRLSTKSITFNATEGYYTTIGRHLWRDSENRDHFGEFTFWGLHSWDDWAQASGRRLFGGTVGSLFSPFDLRLNVLDTSVGGFNWSDTHRLSYQSSIHNWELNSRIRPRIRKDRLVLQPNGRWRREERPGAHYSFLYGFRVVSIAERSLFQARGQIVSDPDVFNAFGDYHVWTGNSLVGLQIGGDMVYRYNKWSWGFRGKTGAMVNAAHHISRVRSGGDPFADELPNYTLKDSRSGMAAVIEFGVTGKYMITPHFWLNAGYDLMWVTGLALAPEQMDFSAQPSGHLNTGGTVFYHGLTAGFEWTF